MRSLLAGEKLLTTLTPLPAAGNDRMTKVVRSKVPDVDAAGENKFPVTITVDGEDADRHS